MNNNQNRNFYPLQVQPNPVTPKYVHPTILQSNQPMNAPTTYAKFVPYYSKQVPQAVRATNYPVPACYVPTETAALHAQKQFQSHLTGSLYSPTSSGAFKPMPQIRVPICTSQQATAERFAPIQRINFIRDEPLPSCRLPQHQSTSVIGTLPKFEQDLLLTRHNPTRVHTSANTKLNFNQISSAKEFAVTQQDMSTTNQAIVCKTDDEEVENLIDDQLENDEERQSGHHPICTTAEHSLSFPNQKELIRNDILEPEVINTKSCSPEDDLMKPGKQHRRGGLISSQKYLRKSKLNVYTRRSAANQRRRNSSHSATNDDDFDGSHVNVKQVESKTFDGIPKEWHQTLRIKNPDTQRVKLLFKCRYAGCSSVFKKSCNLRDHFRKHTGQRPFKCPQCLKTFTQSGNLGRHLKNVHQFSRREQQRNISKRDSDDETESEQYSYAPLQEELTPNKE